jgi:hypothetical protein
VERERAAPPRLGTLTQGLAGQAPGEKPLVPAVPGAPPAVDTRITPPRAIAILTPGPEPERPRLRTTVGDRAAARVAAPTLEAVQADIPGAVAARLVRVPAPGVVDRGTVMARGSVPLTRAARGAGAAVAARGAARDGAARLHALSRAMSTATRGRVRAGEIAVLQMPNALRDLDLDAPRPRLTVAGGAARVVVLAHGGEVRADSVATSVTVPRGAERLVVLALGKRSTPLSGLAGWHGGQELPFIGWSSALAPGVVLQAEGGLVRSRRQRFRAGWIQAAELVDASAIVHTRFADPVRTVAIVLDDRAGTSAPRDLALTLRHGTRPRGADGEPLAPEVVVTGNRTVLLYAVTPGTPRRASEGLVVSVARQRGVHLAGVLGDVAAPAIVAERFARRGLDALPRPLVESTAGEITLGWSKGTAAPTSPRRSKGRT